MHAAPPSISKYYAATRRGRLLLQPVLVLVLVLLRTFAVEGTHIVLVTADTSLDTSRQSPFGGAAASRVEGRGAGWTFLAPCGRCAFILELAAYSMQRNSRLSRLWTDRPTVDNLSVLSTQYSVCVSLGIRIHASPPHHTVTLGGGVEYIAPHDSDAGTHMSISRIPTVPVRPSLALGHWHRCAAPRCSMAIAAGPKTTALAVAGDVRRRRHLLGLRRRARARAGRRDWDPPCKEPVLRRLLLLRTWMPGILEFGSWKSGCPAKPSKQASRDGPPRSASRRDSRIQNANLRMQDLLALSITGPLPSGSPKPQSATHGQRRVSLRDDAYEATVPPIEQHLDDRDDRPRSPFRRARIGTSAPPPRARSTPSSPARSCAPGFSSLSSSPFSLDRRGGTQRSAARWRLVAVAGWCSSNRYENRARSRRAGGAPSTSSRRATVALARCGRTLGERLWGEAAGTHVLSRRQTATCLRSLGPRRWRKRRPRPMALATLARGWRHRPAPRNARLGLVAKAVPAQLERRPRTVQSSLRHAPHNAHSRSAFIHYSGSCAPSRNAHRRHTVCSVHRAPRNAPARSLAAGNPTFEFGAPTLSNSGAVTLAVCGGRAARRGRARWLRDAQWIPDTEKCGFAGREASSLRTRDMQTKRDGKNAWCTSATLATSSGDTDRNLTTAACAEKRKSRFAALVVIWRSGLGASECLQLSGTRRRADEVRQRAANASRMGRHTKKSASGYSPSRTEHNGCYERTAVKEIQIQRSLVGRVGRAASNADRIFEDVHHWRYGGLQRAVTPLHTALRLTIHVIPRVLDSSPISDSREAYSDEHHSSRRWQHRQERRETIRARGLEKRRDMRRCLQSVATYSGETHCLKVELAGDENSETLYDWRSTAKRCKTFRAPNG
ncbi:hypothetical protein PYCCODRAFT_1460153 [Trametes coccinea BRFM310]|uniref:Uncharacterized protein n=1 Tax=Trametes coccinea (strain BRFM310) TaxID=1353009 RepID=A0A1Y2IHJ9_TRAC3|nr:hypothetical protein PYCCODRAFT_1460153 [Trametes coccinea BRFM310]